MISSHIPVFVELHYLNSSGDWLLCAVIEGAERDLRELTKAKLRRSKEKEDGVKTEFPD